jgi:SAM-dependent methyltransferase
VFSELRPLTSQNSAEEGVGGHFARSHVVDLVRTIIATSELTLDIDTGGGEFLERVAPARGTVVATEGHPPNVQVAARRLAPLGITVVHAASAPDNVDQSESSVMSDGSMLPFRDDTFVAVIDRHSSYWPEEVHRVLRPGGRFLTQQRGEAGGDGEAWEDLFGRPTHPHQRFDLAFATRQLEETGFEIERAEVADTPMVFGDLAGVIYYLRLVPWAVDGFDLDADGAALERIQRGLEQHGQLRICGSHMLIESVRV